MATTKVTTMKTVSRAHANEASSGALPAEYWQWKASETLSRGDREIARLTSLTNERIAALEHDTAVTRARAERDASIMASRANEEITRISNRYNFAGQVVQSLSSAIGTGLTNYYGYKRDQENLAYERTRAALKFDLDSLTTRATLQAQAIKNESAQLALDQDKSDWTSRKEYGNAIQQLLTLPKAGKNNDALMVNGIIQSKLSAGVTMAPAELEAYRGAMDAWAGMLADEGMTVDTLEKASFLSGPVSQQLASTVTAAYSLNSQPHANFLDAIQQLGAAEAALEAKPTDEKTSADFVSAMARVKAAGEFVPGSRGLVSALETADPKGVRSMLTPLQSVIQRAKATKDFNAGASASNGLRVPELRELYRTTYEGLVAQGLADPSGLNAYVNAGVDDAIGMANSDTSPGALLYKQRSGAVKAHNIVMQAQNLASIGRGEDVVRMVHEARTQGVLQYASPQDIDALRGMEVVVTENGQPQSRLLREELYRVSQGGGVGGRKGPAVQTAQPFGGAIQNQEHQQRLLQVIDVLLDPKATPTAIQSSREAMQLIRKNEPAFNVGIENALRLPAQRVNVAKARAAGYTDLADDATLSDLLIAVYRTRKDRQATGGLSGLVNQLKAQGLIEPLDTEFRFTLPGRPAVTPSPAGPNPFPKG